MNEELTNQEFGTLLMGVFLTPGLLLSPKIQKVINKKQQQNVSTKIQTLQSSGYGIQSTIQ